MMPKFEAESALEAIEKHHVTSFITVPAIMSDMISFIRYFFNKYIYKLHFH